MGDSKPVLHPALSITNLKSFIPITLDTEKVDYASWAELFKIHAKVYQVLDHIIPATKDAVPAPSSTDDKDLWERLDAVVLQWMYGTISLDLLHTILEPNSTAYKAWTRLENIFLDNKGSRAIILEQQFTALKLRDFPNMSTYCQRLKTLSDQLASVGAPVNNQRLVLRLCGGLTEAYNSVAPLIEHSNPLPPFDQAHG